jgi:hypothetical protein
MSRSHTSFDLPPGPPPEVLAELEQAWERAQWPLQEDLELHFESEPRLARAWGVLRLPDGTVVERISAREALAIACGDAALVPAPAIVV